MKLPTLDEMLAWLHQFGHVEITAWKEGPVDAKLFATDKHRRDASSLGATVHAAVARLCVAVAAAKSEAP